MEETLPPPAMADALRRMNLGQPRSARPLTGGVSSDIWAIETASETVCVKRALPQLRVARLWQAPVERSGYEARWLREAARIVPEAVPRLLGEDKPSGTIAMEYLDPLDHPLWKNLLRDGTADAGFAAMVADRIVRIHAATAADPRLAEQFPTDGIFHSIRLEPYLLATAAAHPDVAGQLEALVATTAATKRALVHGDVSPKNILSGPKGPVLLDAECAWWGDPAFDLAFCLNHMLLKCLWRPSLRAALLGCYDALTWRYLEGVVWEDRAEFERRAARLLPGLFLARIDGKSPVEYVTEEADRDRVRRVARAYLTEPSAHLASIRDAWALELQQ